MKKYRHLSFTDRLQIESLLKARTPKKEIARILGVHPNTIYNEIKRGRYQRLSSDLVEYESYSPDISERRYRENLAAKGGPLKIGNDHQLAAWIENKILTGKYSPAAALGEIERKGLKFSVTIKSVNTIYHYIDKGIFLHLTNRDLPRRGNKKRPYRHIQPARAPKGNSIERRPSHVTQRNTFGNWEMDTIVSGAKGNGCQLVLTERLTRHEMILPLRDKTSDSVVRALDRLERRYGKLFYKLFQSITCDNGSEFADCEGMERAKYRKGNRTNLYYCHPYSAYERGSNENQNAMIRRHFPKGTDFSKVPRSEIQRVQDWLNNYPRKIFNFYSANDMFLACLNALN